MGITRVVDLQEYLSGLDLGTDVHVLDASVSQGGSNPLVKAVVDTEEGITIDEIVRITRQLRDDDSLARHLGVSTCRVEVTSPGVSYGLRQPWQFHRHVGRQLAVQIGSPEGEVAEEPARVEGKLVQAGPDGILVEVAGSHEPIAWERIQKATVQLAW